MLKVFRKRMEDDKGFTLIELMVVVLIIAILLAIAIPTFLRVRRTAQDRQAQSSLSDALKAEKAYYVDDNNLVYTGDSTELELIEPSINYDGTAGTDSCAAFANPKCVQVTTATTTGGAAGAQEVLLIAQSASATFWAVKDVASGTGTGAVGPGTYYNDDGDTAAPGAATVIDAGW